MSRCCCSRRCTSGDLNVPCEYCGDDCTLYELCEDVGGLGSNIIRFFRVVCDNGEDDTISNYLPYGPPYVVQNESDVGECPSSVEPSEGCIFCGDECVTTEHCEDVGGLGTNIIRFFRLTCNNGDTQTVDDYLPDGTPYVVDNPANVDACDIPTSTGSDADWFEAGTTDPPQDINDSIYHLGKVSIGTNLDPPNHRFFVNEDTNEMFAYFEGPATYLELGVNSLEGAGVVLGEFALQLGYGNNDIVAQIGVATDPHVGLGLGNIIPLSTLHVLDEVGDAATFSTQIGSGNIRPISTTRLTSQDNFGSFIGPSLTFEGIYESGGDFAAFSFIHGFKWDGSDGDTDGGLRFSTKQEGVGWNNGVLIDYRGYTGINTLSPSYRFDVRDNGGFGQTVRFVSNSSQGVSLVLEDDSAANQKKFIRSKDGRLELINDAFNSELFVMTDGGNFGISNTDIEFWSGIHAFEWPRAALAGSASSAVINLVSNAYFNGGWRRKTNGFGSKFTVDEVSIDASIAINGSADAGSGFRNGFSLSNNITTGRLRTIISAGDGNALNRFNTLSVLDGIDFSSTFVSNIAANNPNPRSTISVLSTEGFAAGLGGSITLDGKFESASVNATSFAYIHGYKANSTDGNLAGQLRLATYSGSAWNDGLLINEIGQAIFAREIGVYNISSPNASIDAAHSGTDALVALLGADISGSGRTNNTRKVARLATPHYINGEEPVGFLFIDSDVAINEIAIGGRSNVFNAATNINFYTATNNTTTFGTRRVSIDNTGLLTASFGLSVSGNFAFNGETPSAARVWGAVTGTLSRTAFVTDTVPLASLAYRVGQLINDLKEKGILDE